ncbi:MAG TPA: tRNA 2-thiouridine(34) synthase MnmA [Gammaproteobacteria bacterium]|nr:tRNA 2-thiouridine(34) synthase MnmA [Gammaproteobacteria bacterium]
MTEDTPSSRHVVVGMSGGVDSSVAALLLLERGWRVEGLFMRNWEEEGHDGPCQAERDARDALAVCERLGIGLDAVSFAREYRERVFSYFLEEYRSGRTPNPDVLCNREIKFRAFLDHALATGAARIATGHYARIEARDGRYCLLKGVDGEKDQSYFLYTLGQDQLARSLFPLGNLRKQEVRALARRAGFPNHAKKDSTGICFIGERDFRAFLQNYLPASPGEIRTPEGTLLGQHQGLMYHTIGQRKGLGIGGRRNDSGEPWYVAGKDLAANVLLVVQGRDHPLLYSTALVAEQLHWVAGEAPAMPARLCAKIRYRQPDQPCVVSDLGGGRCRVEFLRPQRAVAPGQSVVFYRGEECLGGGVIANVEGSLQDRERHVAHGG